MNEQEKLAELTRFAESYEDPALGIEKAVLSLDERQDGEPVSRVLLLLRDPDNDTWDVERVSELRQSLGRKATELDLPPVTLTLVAESERKDVDVLA
ncbi:MAG: hypothetical protein ACRDL6_10810 [Solirubrobacterales bacterium]